MGIAEMYRTGRGSIQMRATAEIEEDANGGQRILVSQMPFQTSVEEIGTKIGELVNDRRIEGIRTCATTYRPATPSASSSISSATPTRRWC